MEASLDSLKNHAKILAGNFRDTQRFAEKFLDRLRINEQSFTEFMKQASKTVVSRDEAGVYHCVSRCVRRVFLCGRDAYSGKDYEHRRDWVRERLKELNECFGVEVFAYSVMSNHTHIVLRTRPDLVDSWSADETGASPSTAATGVRFRRGRRLRSPASEG